MQHKNFSFFPGGVKAPNQSESAQLPLRKGANLFLFRPAKEHSTTHIDIEVPRPNIAPSHLHTSSINLHQDQPTQHHHTHNYLNSTIDIAERQYRTQVQPNFQDRVSITSTVEPSKVIINDKMGYYDEDGTSTQLNHNIILY